MIIHSKLFDLLKTVQKGVEIILLLWVILLFLFCYGFDTNVNNSSSLLSLFTSVVLALSTALYQPFLDL